jgi:hypothetical protein
MPVFLMSERRSIGRAPCEKLKTNPKHRAMKNKHRPIVESESPPKAGGLPFLNQQKLQGL